MTPGEKVVQVARKYLGVRELPVGSSSNSDNGGPIDRWEGEFGIRNEPWCACAVHGWYQEAGVDMQGIGSPGVAAMCDKAKAVGALTNVAAPGIIGAYYGVHTFIIGHVISANSAGTAGLVFTYEGNTGDAVGTHTRAFGPGTGMTLIAVKALRDNPAGGAPKPERLYYIEDDSAQPIVYGRWRTQAGRDVKLAKLPASRKAAARPFHDAKGWGWFEGPRKLYGPWHDAAARDIALASLRKHQPARPFRAVSKVATVNAQADAMGKTT